MLGRDGSVLHTRASALPLPCPCLARAQPGLSHPVLFLCLPAFALDDSDTGLASPVFWNSALHMASHSDRIRVAYVGTFLLWCHHPGEQGLFPQACGLSRHAAPWRALAPKGCPHLPASPRPAGALLPGEAVSLSPSHRGWICFFDLAHPGFGLAQVCGAGFIQVGAFPSCRP